ncbi:adenosylmethionine-8-amino-7-oxononanoate aminotransferase [Aurantimicrobium minutum]|uniref:aminotransferase class III-fold pyridoxal phosphate-dependent enzyme n=1 Tax=Aurantimicrobium minutum TaxID=708131 RepID=UPI0024737ADF|nr:aminotransferase class III-fold pyridoxal phosphate-dependent enzyme [Aurantimicrobium minutum]MDH6255099.1 adenosylmethionine-8-amino-7-oxononanoate aminotransferase [Aurantimicrobium minutum]MDH6409924.1 adenosylmethionine-8-amino-7-oxononanoate aminotransferase [Aurantimicrobium minutum]MDH6424119.1 adenosylmethionine-8-amino-7-oxononanoate aminotransferase [Aurantimicrobium minutum]
MVESSLLKQIVDKEYPLATHGVGVFLYDQNGRDYIDGSSGAMTASLGHGLRDIAQAMKEQAEKVAFTYRTQFSNQPAEDLASQLTSLAPGDLNWAFFVNSGSEASEYAIRATVNHWRSKGQPEKVEVLGRHTSYHGMTMGALSMSGHEARRPDYGTLLHEFPTAPPAYAFRFGRPGESEEQYSLRAAQEFEDAITKHGVSTVGAIIVEPIVGAAGGVLVPPQGYLRHLREMCDRLDILLIVDEVITGLGRTGAWFACETEGIVPDMLLFGKGISGGYSPMAGVLLRDHLVSTMRDGSGVSPFGHTYSNNPLGSAISLAVLEYMDRNNILDNVNDRGRELHQGLLKLEKQFDFVADVRGKGLLWGFEFVRDKTTKEAPNPKENISSSFVDECFNQGLIVYPAGIAPLNNAIILSPPLIISQQEISKLLNRLESSLEKFSSRFN